MKPELRPMIVRHAMTERDQTVAQILEIELEMFLAVNGEDNSSCQEHPDAFKLHRRAQFAAWSLPTLRSYLDDLRRAQRSHENLMTLKYARMEGIIPPLNPAAQPIIDKIVEQECLWAEDFSRSNPGARLARPVYARDESPGVVSSETYSRAELETYSARTLEHYYSDVIGMSSRGENRIECAVRYMRELALRRNRSGPDRSCS